jgi:hypothetical protein
MKWPLVLLLICVGAFVAQALLPGFEDALILRSADVLARPWTLITAVFLHADFAHLFYNMFALVMFGWMLERIVGERRFIAIFFVGGLIASVVGAWFYAAMLGASGAVFAVMGTLAALRPKMLVWLYGLPVPLAVAAALWIAIDLVGMLAPSGIANAAHIAGLAFGVAVGLGFRRKFMEKPRRGQWPRVLSERELEEWEKRHMERH